MRSRQLRQASICQFSTCSWSLVEDLARYQFYGCESIGLWRRKLEDHGVESAIDQIFESGLNVSSLHWAGGFTGQERTLPQAISDTFDAIQMAAKVNAGCLLVHPGGMGNHIYNHINGVVRGAMKEVTSYAADCGVQIVVEPVLCQSNSPWTIYETLDQYLELLEVFPTLGINLDLYHVGFCDEAFDRLEEYIDRVKLVQLADRTVESLARAQQSKNLRFNYRLPLGDGDLQIEQWMERLRLLGYSGAYEVEVHGVAMLNRGHFGLVDRSYDFLQTQLTQKVPSKATPVNKETATKKKTEASDAPIR